MHVPSITTYLAVFAGFPVRDRAHTVHTAGTYNSCRISWFLGAIVRTRCPSSAQPTAIKHFGRYFGFVCSTTHIRPLINNFGRFLGYWCVLQRTYGYLSSILAVFLDICVLTAHIRLESTTLAAFIGYFGRNRS